MEDGFLPREEIRKVTGYKSDVTIWRWERLGLFPRRRRLGPNSVGWLKSEVEEWIKSRPLADADAPLRSRSIGEFDEALVGGGNVSG